MTELHEDWHDWRYDGRGYYLVNDPEITFQDEVEAQDYCDEHNRALAGKAVIRERAKIVKWLRSLDQDTYINRFVPTTLANWIEAGMYETDKDDTND